MGRGMNIEAGNSFRGLRSFPVFESYKEYPKELIPPEIRSENRADTIEQFAQNVEAVEMQMPLMSEKTSRNQMHLTGQL